MNRVFLLLGCSLVTLYAFGQRSITSQGILWLDYSNRLKLDEHWQIHTDLSLRRFVFPDRLHQAILPRVHVQYKLEGNAEVGAGTTLFLQALPQDGRKEVDQIRPELRPHQTFYISQKFGKTSINHRYQVEERFFLRTNEHEPQFNLRFRYRLQVQIPLNRTTSALPLALNLSDEIMLNAGQEIIYNLFDQNRIYAGIRFQFSKTIATEAGYMNWFQQRSSGTDFYNRHIARLAITHTLNLDNQ